MGTPYERALSVAKSVYSAQVSKIEKRFSDGYATCTYATFELGKELHKEKIGFTVCSGDYDDGGHWWILVTVDLDLKGKTCRVILDLGDNISEKNLASGKIPMKVIKDTDPEYKKYKAENYLTWSQYQSEYRKIKNF